MITDIMLLEVNDSIATLSICLLIYSSPCCILCISFSFFTVFLPFNVPLHTIQSGLACHIYYMYIICWALSQVMCNCTVFLMLCSSFVAFLFVLTCDTLLLFYTLFCLSYQTLYCSLNNLAWLSGTFVLLSISSMIILSLVISLVSLQQLVLWITWVIYAIDGIVHSVSYPFLCICTQ